MHTLRQPTDKQVRLAHSLGIVTQGKSFRVLSAEISDILEVNAFKTVELHQLEPGVKVEYVGSRDDMPRQLVVSTVSKNGYLFFKRTSKYCRPWDVRVRELAE